MCLLFGSNNEHSSSSVAILARLCYLQPRLAVQIGCIESRPLHGGGCGSPSYEGVHLIYKIWLFWGNVNIFHYRTTGQNNQHGFSI